jgi:hypothetical protein
VYVYCYDVCFTRSHFFMHLQVAEINSACEPELGLSFTKLSDQGGTMWRLESVVPWNATKSNAETSWVCLHSLLRQAGGCILYWCLGGGEFGPGAPWASPGLN